MDAAVDDELFKRHTGNLATDRFEAGEHDGFRRVVDDEIDAGEIFEGADVAAFAADDTALHLVIWKRNDGNGGFCNMICSAALDGAGDDVARGFFGGRLGFGFLVLIMTARLWSTSLSTWLNN